MFNKKNYCLYQINVGCSKTYTPQYPVYLEYSHDGGLSWKLIEEKCLPGEICETYTLGSVYHSEAHGDWKLISLPINKDIASR